VSPGTHPTGSRNQADIDVCLLGGIWAVSVYAAHGTFSFSDALIDAACWTILLVGFRWRQRGRKELFWALLLTTLVGAAFLAVTPA
jgi:hypothetical protein